jgi:hypothetical protein
MFKVLPELISLKEEKGDEVKPSLQITLSIEDYAPVDIPCLWQG